MNSPPYTLFRRQVPGGIAFHEDILSTAPTIISARRAHKANREPQMEMEDDQGPDKCIFCFAEKSGSPRLEGIPGRTAHFENDFPYLPLDHRVVYMFHEDHIVRRRLHRYKLREFGRCELYYLLMSCTELGKSFRAESMPTDNLDILRFVVGFNLGKLAGQSQPHFHAQCGWEVLLHGRTVMGQTLPLFFAELKGEGLVLYEDDVVRIVAPWTPTGQYAIDIYFNGKYEIPELNHEDVKIFAHCGHQLVQDYVECGIQNLNIYFGCSPSGRQTEPLVAHFVPRVNMIGFPEMRGTFVVDTSPFAIADRFRNINWSEIISKARAYDPAKDFYESFESVSASE